MKNRSRWPNSISGAEQAQTNNRAQTCASETDLHGKPETGRIFKQMGLPLFRRPFLFLPSRRTLPGRTAMPLKLITGLCRFLSRKKRKQARWKIQPHTCAHFSEKHTDPINKFLFLRSRIELFLHGFLGRRVTTVHFDWIPSSWVMLGHDV